MKMYIKGMMVDDQKKALEFYTGVLGFVEKHNIPMGEHAWITVESPEEPGGVELSLEPNTHPAAKVFQEALLNDGIPWTAFEVDSVDAEHARLAEKGVEFTVPPTDAGPSRIAIFDDTCGNLIQIIELKD